MIDARGLHRSNIALLRRCVKALDVEPDYVLTDGFPVPRMPCLSLGVKKGDAVSASVSAAGIASAPRPSTASRSQAWVRRRSPGSGAGTWCVRERMDVVMEPDDIERFEEERELELYREYRDVLPMFTYVIETERRFYLANKVDIAHLDGGWVQVDLQDAWVWDMFRPARFVATVRVMTRRDVNVEELARRDETTTIPDS